VKELGLILADASESLNTSHIAKLLQFFGISTGTVTVEEFIPGQKAFKENSSKVRVFCSSEVFGKLIEALNRDEKAVTLWSERVHSAFIFSANRHIDLPKLMQHTPIGAPIIRCDRDGREWTISTMLPQLCGAMSGLRVPVTKGVAKGDVPEAFLDESGTVFAQCEYKKVPVFHSTTTTVVDIEDEIVVGNFDIRDHFLSAVPIVMFVKWAFAETCWNAPENSACLVIDDPLLRPRYGFLNYKSLLQAMELHNFSTNIAFIPWNWGRSDHAIVNMFKNHCDRYSLSIHGCDHTGAEFGTQNVHVLASKARQAIDRMSRHECTTGLGYDRIMVFPQGVFSAAAMQVLKQASFTATVNTEVLCTDPQRPQIRISDVWDVAVMKYGEFPLFTRRYSSQGIENFAFDILLGKPCIMVTHHDAFRDQGRHLFAFINSLNKLNCKLTWRSLGEVIRGSCRQRKLSPDLVETEMYGSELRLENRSGQLRRFCIRKRELDASAIKEVRNGSRPIPWTVSEGRINCEIELPAGDSSTICIIFHGYPGGARCQETVQHKMKTMLRRYLSEVRDNYLLPRRIW
jgi:hypothetical protein